MSGIKLLKIIATRVIFLYLACFLLIWHFLDYHAFINNAIPQTMSRLTPPMDYFSEFVDKKDHYDRFKLLNCINYHQAVAQFFPYQEAEAYGMLGFCYDRLGQSSPAIDAYKKAVASNPDYFWPYYDLGVISYNKGRYAEAADYFKQAIEESPVKTVVLLSRSKVYNDVKLSKVDGSYDVLDSLKQARTQVYTLTMDSLGIEAFNQKSFSKAAGFLQAAIQNDPKNSDAFYYLGLCARAAGKEDMAQALLAQAKLLKEAQDIPRVRFF